MADTATPTTTKNGLNKFAIYVIIGLIALLLTVIIAGTVLIIYFGNMKTPVKTVVVNNTSETTSSSNKMEDFGLLVPLGEKFTIYLQPSEDGDHYLEVAITLEIGEDEKQKAEVEKRVPMILDLINTVIGSKTKEKIAEKEGKEVLRSEIKNSINSKLGSNIVRNIYFEYFVVQ